MSSHATRAGIRVRAALITAIYQKSLQLSTEQNVGDVIGLVAGDTYRIMVRLVEFSGKLLFKLYFIF